MTFGATENILSLDCPLVLLAAIKPGFNKSMQFSAKSVLPSVYGASAVLPETRPWGQEGFEINRALLGALKTLRLAF